MSITSRRIEKCPTPKQRFSDKFPTARTEKMTNSWQMPRGGGGRGRNGHTWNWLCHYHYNLRQIFFLLIGKEPSTWPANNCLQIMVCSCATSSNCVWLWHLAANNILLIHKRNHAFRTPRVKMADHFASRGYTRWSNDKTIIELSYRKISWFVTV